MTDSLEVIFHQCGDPLVPPLEWIVYWTDQGNLSKCDALEAAWRASNDPNFLQRTFEVLGDAELRSLVHQTTIEYIEKHRGHETLAALCTAIKQAVPSPIFRGTITEWIALAIRHGPLPPRILSGASVTLPSMEPQW